MAEVERHRPGARISVPASVRGELDRLAARGTPEALLARRLAERFPTLPTIGRGDAAVVRAAVEHATWVVTADRGLRERLRRAGVTVLAPRDRHRLERFDGRNPLESRASASRAVTVKKRSRLEPSRRGRPTNAGRRSSSGPSRARVR